METQNKIKISSNKSFGIVFFIIFLIIALWPLKSGGDIRLWSLIVSIIFLVLGMINSKLLSPLNVIWFKFGMFLGSLVAPIAMGIVFFLVVTPTGIVMKLLGNDLLNLKKKKSTYWISRTNPKTSMKNQY